MTKKLRRGAVAAVLMLGLAGQPALSQPGGDDLARSMRTFGNITSGQRIGGGAAADKVMWFGRRADGELVVTRIEALPLGGPWGELPPGVVAVMRTRASTPGNAAPEAADVDLARSGNIPVFIVGEWRSPPVIWEVRAEGAAVRVREIDDQGAPQPWRAPTP